MYTRQQVRELVEIAMAVHLDEHGYIRQGELAAALLLILDELPAEGQGESEPDEDPDR